MCAMVNNADVVVSFRAYIYIYIYIYICVLYYILTVLACS